jgi:uncharacterized membrane protein SirB2
MMMLLLKHLHVTCVVLSISGFTGARPWMMQESPWLQKWVRVAPHIIDTILLGSAILLAIQIQQYSSFKIGSRPRCLALIAYIVVGAVGLKYGRTKKIRIAACSAIAIFLYIVLVALTHQVLPFVA